MSIFRIRRGVLGGVVESLHLDDLRDIVELHCCIEKLAQVVMGYATRLGDYIC